jgi:hypothetical protein
VIEAEPYNPEQKTHYIKNQTKVKLFVDTLMLKGRLHIINDSLILVDKQYVLIKNIDELSFRNRGKKTAGYIMMVTGGISALAAMGAAVIGAIYMIIDYMIIDYATSSSTPNVFLQAAGVFAVASVASISTGIVLAVSKIKVNPIDYQIRTQLK